MGKHGGSAKTPVMLNDNLKSKQFYRVIDLISEGPIYGPIDQQHGNSFLVNKTPITDINGGVNIPGISVAWREGSGNQTPINGLNFIESTHMVNLDVKQPTPIVRTITDPDVSRVRVNVGVSGLVLTDSKGNQKNTSVELAIEVNDPSSGGWSNVKTVNITGKISGEYLEAHVIDAPAHKPFDIRVRRATADSTVDTLSNGTVFNSYTEITDDSLSYPYSAVAGAIIDRDQYSDTPERTYHLRGLIVDVPDNYDPIKRTYSGLWTGGWKQEWTNNPAWLFRELVKNDRFGLARHAGFIDVDDGALYSLSQFCDQQVPTGYGTATEPRLTLNAYITEQLSARALLDKIAGMFRGFALWDGMRLTVLVDNPQDPIAVITNANVVDGAFTYSSMKRAERYNAVVVSWCDPENGWKTSKEYVSDDTLIARYGYNETTLEAFGCTSRGQANRAGRWLLETARRETKRIKFQMAREAIAFMPGDIVEVMDNHYAGARFGGRIVSHSGANITVDAPVDSSVAAGDKVGLMNASGRVDHFPVARVSGAVITLQQAPKTVIDGTAFVISANKTATRLFRIMAIEETENSGTYTINAYQHDPHKQAVVDEGAVFEAPNDTLNGFRVPAIENLRVVDVNSETVQVEAQWETATTTRGLTFEVVVYDTTGKKVVSIHRTTDFSLPLYGLDAGSYQLGVRAINQMGMKGPESVITMRVGRPPKPQSVRWDKGIFSATIVPLMGQNYTSDVTFEYWFGDEHQASSLANIEAETNYLGRGAQWSIHGLKASTKYYMYVRTRNGFGVSDFVEVSGEASGDIPGMIQFVDDAVRNSTEFGILTAGIADNKADLGKLSSALGQIGSTWQQFQTDMNNTVGGMTTQVGQADKAAKDALALVATTKTDLEAQISAITGGGNSTFTGLVNDVKQLQQDNQTRITEITGAVDRIDGMSQAILNQVDLWRQDDEVIATSVSQVKATADKAATDLTTEIQARADGDSAITKRIDTMVSTAPGDQGDPDRQALITAITSTESDHDKTLARQITTLDTNFNSYKTAVTTATTAISDANKALGERIDNMFVSGPDSNALNRRIGDVTTTAFTAAANDRQLIKTTLQNHDSMILAERTARSDADKATNSRIDNMVSKTGTGSDKVALMSIIASTESSYDQSLAHRTSMIETTNQGFGTRIATLETAISNSGGSTATRLATLEATTQDILQNGAPPNAATAKNIADAGKNATDAQKAASKAAADVGTLGTSLSNVNNTVLDAHKIAVDATARISTLETSGAKPDGATAQRISNIETKANNAATQSALNGAISRITTIETSGAKPNAATASRIATLESKVGTGIGATVQTAVSTEVGNKLSAQWGVKTAVTSNGHTYAAGLQLGLSGTPSKVESNFIVNADTFSIYNSKNGKSDLAFAATNGQTFIKSAFIQDGSITNAKIGDTITSNNWNGNTQGWAIRKDGLAVFNNVVVRGRIEADSGYFHGDISGASGTFSGSVRAEHIIGDVATMHWLDRHDWWRGQGGTWYDVVARGYHGTGGPTAIVSVPPIKLMCRGGSGSTTGGTFHVQLWIHDQLANAVDIGPAGPRHAASTNYIGGYAAVGGGGQFVIKIRVMGDGFVGSYPELWIGGGAVIVCSDRGRFF